MSSLLHRVLAVFIISSFCVGVVGIAAAEEDDSLPPRKIVVFKEGVSDKEKSDIIVKARGVKIKHMRSGNEVVAPDFAVEARLLAHPKVERVEDDIVVEALGETNGDVNGSARTKSSAVAQQQRLPWGIDRIDAEKVLALAEAGATVKVGIIDTGISVSHPDLAANIKGGYSAVWYTTNYNDDNGHGSHVAGIVAGVNNTIGVVGAASAADLYAIKVLDRNGSGYLSDVIEGIDWATANGMRVINMSLGTSADSPLLHDAVARAYNAGVVVVAAAGNSGGAVSYPAAYPESIAVAATDSTNAAPYWSSRGPEVDVAAPGVNIYSTYKGTKYATLSGTSMASPHVAGTVALVLKRATDTAYDELNNCVSAFDVDCDGAWDPAEVAHKLKNTATDLGVAGEDTVYGAGLINAYSAYTL